MKSCVTGVFAAFAIFSCATLLLGGCKISENGTSCSVSLGGVSCSKSATVNGTYQIVDPAADAFITFFDDGHYALARHGSGADGCPETAYTEFGTYSASASATTSQNGNSTEGGTLTAKALISSDAASSSQCGFSGTVTVTHTSSNGNSTDTLTYSNGSSAINLALLQVNEQGGGSVIGSFHFNDGSGGTGTTIGSVADVSATHANVEIVTFLDSSHYFAVNFDPNAPAGGGLEAGCYSASGSQYSFTDNPASCSVTGSQLSLPPYSNLGQGDTLSGTAAITFNNDGSFNYMPSFGIEDMALPIPPQIND
jgi:hypothetical protein